MFTLYCACISGRFCYLCRRLFAQGWSYGQSWSIWTCDQHVHWIQQGACWRCSSSRGSTCGKFWNTLLSLLYILRQCCNANWVFRLSNLNSTDHNGSNIFVLIIIILLQETAFSRKRSFRNKLKKRGKLYIWFCEVLKFINLYEYLYSAFRCLVRIFKFVCNRKRDWIFVHLLEPCTLLW